MKPNNVNLPGMMAFVEEAQSNPGVLKKRKRVEGNWHFAEGEPQFEATLAYPAGERTLRADLAPFMGGEGLAPDPIQYCLYGLAACFAATFASLAAADGVGLRSLRVIAENQIDLTQPMGLGEAPVVKQVTLTLLAASDADQDTLTALERRARERCPGLYCLIHPIPVDTRVVRQTS
jgi:uncharacterized OsmC-like protein